VFGEIRLELQAERVERRRGNGEEVELARRGAMRIDAVPDADRLEGRFAVDRLSRHTLDVGGAVDALQRFVMLPTHDQRQRRVPRRDNPAIDVGLYLLQETRRQRGGGLEGDDPRVLRRAEDNRPAGERGAIDVVLPRLYVVPQTPQQAQHEAGRQRQDEKKLS
jgi:hypothetical protein